MDPVYEGENPCRDCDGMGCQVRDSRSDNPTPGPVCQRCKGSGQEPGGAA